MKQESCIGKERKTSQKKTAKINFLKYWKKDGGKYEMNLLKSYSTVRISQRTVAAGGSKRNAHEIFMVYFN